MARRIDDPHMVADLVAEVFIAVLDSAHTYRPGLGSEIGWLYGVARNLGRTPTGGTRAPTCRTDQWAQAPTPMT